MEGRIRFKGREGLHDRSTLHTREVRGKRNESVENGSRTGRRRALYNIKRSVLNNNHYQRQKMYIPNHEYLRHHKNLLPGLCKHRQAGFMENIYGWTISL